MTKEKFKKQFGLELYMFSGKNCYFFTNENYINEEFERLYERLSKVIKFSNIKDILMIRQEPEEDAISFLVKYKLTLCFDKYESLTTTYHFHFVKTSSYVNFYTLKTDQNNILRLGEYWDKNHYKLWEEDKI